MASSKKFRKWHSSKYCLTVTNFRAGTKRTTRLTSLCPPYNVYAAHSQYKWAWPESWEIAYIERQSLHSETPTSSSTTTKCRVAHCVAHLFVFCCVKGNITQHRSKHRSRIHFREILVCAASQNQNKQHFRLPWPTRQVWINLAPKPNVGISYLVRFFLYICNFQSSLVWGKPKADNG